MKQEFFGYIRVSTKRQGEKGVSLTEQRDAIERFARQESLQITTWFEERETAAKKGRRQFNAMLSQLREGRARGVIMHKVDRGARNLRDWSELADLMDAGVEVRFASGDMDLGSRGGRLSADIQAVVAADYIRNLREEIRKGVYGRLKQGIYPLAAPIGYLDNGSGELKTFDPERAPLIKLAFELYATGAYSFHALAEELRRRGLRSRGDRSVSYKRLSEILNNPFYAGVIRIATTGELFEGQHEPLVTQETFDRVQSVLKGRLSPRSSKHDFLFRRLLKCGFCGYSLTGERQKGFIYYRCHTTDCPRSSIRQDQADRAIRRSLKGWQLTADEYALIEPYLAKSDADWERETKQAIERLRFTHAQANAKLERLTDALIDRLIDREIFEAKRASLVATINRARQEIEELRTKSDARRVKVTKFFELWKTVYSSYKDGNWFEKRDVLLNVTSNRLVYGKKLELELSEPFRGFGKRRHLQKCADSTDNFRTVIEDAANDNELDGGHKIA